MKCRIDYDGLCYWLVVNGARTIGFSRYSSAEAALWEKMRELSQQTK